MGRWPAVPIMGDMPISAPGPIVVGVERSERSRDALALARTLARAVGRATDPGRRLPRRRPLGGDAAGRLRGPRGRRRPKATLEWIARPLAGVAASSRAVPCTSVGTRPEGGGEGGERARDRRRVVRPRRARAGRARKRRRAAAARRPCPVAVAPRGRSDAARDTIRRIGLGFVATPGPTRRCTPRSGSRAHRRGHTRRQRRRAAVGGLAERIGLDSPDHERLARDNLSQSLKPRHRRRRVAGGERRPGRQRLRRRRARRVSEEVDLLVCGSRDHGPWAASYSAGPSRPACCARPAARC